MNITAMKYFIKLAEYKNFSFTAEKLYISQTALSKMIGSLEDEIGEKLFIRGKSSLLLSEAGEIYLIFAKKIVSLYEESQHIIKDSLLENGILRIGLTDLSDTLIGAIGLLHGAYPNVQIRLYSNQFSAEAFSASKLDMIMLSETEADGLNYIPIAVKNELYAIMNAHHPLAHNKSLDFSDLERESLIFSIKENGELDAAYNYCIQSGFLPKISFLCDNSKYQMELILNTSSIAISFNLFRHFRESMDGIVSIPINIKNNIHDRLVLAYSQDNENLLIHEMIKCIHIFRDIRRTTGNFPCGLNPILK